ncbi:hypothetical protein VOLCADRAFT_105493 [Volvox carteri f. nagariensis]|uniref:RAP domain-containing protein n=1 Tax=Volvox carteri f. nagariensis TaxID=3068 RepID=D8U176_VOLCA|nr:uncharacterized protein VOLCADRAFT_105493 [Volvox carteri f. nagariensis]EFJ46585.1 hypothetical protein VOLCADRAFT_105493 [Volvox carteri f. nagariensis]|eukprot:XP_002952442.1 hypothetical protein VOLCADRAFT_105493 [Volvox carteri f. nagariensis]
MALLGLVWSFSLGPSLVYRLFSGPRDAASEPAITEVAAQPGVTAAFSNPSGTITIGYPSVEQGEPGPLVETTPLPGEPAVPSEGPSGGQWGGLEGQLLACRSVHSVQRFLQLMGPRTDAELIGSAVVHLSHLVLEEPPDGDVERQLLAGLLGELTQRLRGCVRQLGRGQMTALVCAMSRLHCYDGPLLREVVTAAREVAGELSSRQTSGLIWAFGRYHRDFSFRLEPGWTAALLQGALPRLQQAKPQEVAMMLYGSALLREPPAATTLAALLAASLAGMSAAGGSELSMTIWSLATLRLYPGDEWMRAFLCRCDAATRTFASGAAVSNVLYSLASMRVQPPAPWMLNFLWQAQRRMNTMDGQSLVMMWWALGRMRYRPDRKWLTRFFRYTRSAVIPNPGPDSHIGARSSVQQQVQGHSPHLQTAMQTGSQRQLELWRRQRLQQRQRRPGPWVNTDGSALPDVGELPPQAYNTLLWACVRLSCRPMGTWLPLFCAAVQPLLAAWPPHELSALLWGLARLRWRPRDDWMTEFCAAARGTLSLFQPPDCVMMLVALSKLCSGLGYRISDGDLANLLAQRLAPYYSRLQTTTLISVLLAVSRITPRVRTARMEEVLAAVLDRVRAAGIVDAAQPADGGAISLLDETLDREKQHKVLPGVSRSGYQQQYEGPQVHERDGKELQLNILQTGSPHQPLTPSSRLQLSRPQHSVARQVAPSPAAAAVALPPLTARECANAVFAVGCVALWPSYNDALRSICGQLMRELLPRAFLLAPAFNGVDLVLLVQGVAMARVRVSPRWMRRHEEQALKRLQAGELQPGQLRELHRAYHALDYIPELLPPFAAGRGVEGTASPVDPSNGAQDELYGDVQDGGAAATHPSSLLPPAVADARGSCGISMGGVESVSEGECGSGTPGVSAERSMATTARRRRAAQLRRRRVTAAIERRVAQARRNAAELRLQCVETLPVDTEPPEMGESTPSLPAPHPMPPAFVTKATAEGALGVTHAPDARRELEAAERELRFRRKVIQQFTAVARRGARTAQDSVAGSSVAPSPRQPVAEGTDDSMRRLPVDRSPGSGDCGTS